MNQESADYSENSKKFEEVLIVVPWYSEHDAISNDAYWQQQYLLSKGIKCHLYAEGYSTNLKHRLITYNECQRLISEPRNLLIYHHGVYWIQGESIFNQARCSLCIKYHNITPPEFYRPYDRISTYATEMGRDQTARFLKSGKIWLCMADSAYNIDDLRAYSLLMPHSEVVAPFTHITDFDSVEADNVIAQELRSGRNKNLLFVGRVVPNKGHSHLLHVLTRYIDFYGADIRLNIIGAVSLSEDLYFVELENLISSLSLGRNVAFHQKIGLKGLKAFYENSDVFLLMSEHEGFCVPILESQYMGLPIVALDRAAVGETLGENQILSKDLDYDFFACAIRHVTDNTSVRESLRDQGFLNYERFKPDAILKKTLECLTSL